MLFNTHAFYKALEQGTFTKEQAEALTKAQEKAFEEALEKEVATKGDVNTLRIEIKAIEASLRKDLAETKVELIKWVAGMLLAQAGLIAALVKLL